MFCSFQVRALVDGLYARTVSLLEEKKAFVEGMAQALLTREVLQLEVGIFAHQSFYMSDRPLIFSS
jgi:hypothetical protein